VRIGDATSDEDAILGGERTEITDGMGKERFGAKGGGWGSLNRAGRLRMRRERLGGSNVAALADRYPPSSG